MQNDYDVAKLIEISSERLQGIRRYLENDCGIWRPSDDLSKIARALSLIGQRHDSENKQHSDIIDGLQNDINTKRRLSVEARQQFIKFEAQIARLEAANRRYQEELDHVRINRVKTEAEIATAYQRGLKDGRDAERKQQNQPYGADETLIVRLLARGRELFSTNDFSSAMPILQQARTKITMLTTDRRQLYDKPELHYHLAICGAYVKDIDAAKTSLGNFLQYTVVNTADEMLYTAHVQHLLSQVQIGRGHLADAETLCNKAFSIRERHLPITSNERNQTTALSARIMQLKKYAGAELLRETIPVRASREALRRAYGFLAPLDNVRDTEPFSLPKIATELLPIWTMTSMQIPSTTPKAKAQPKSLVSTQKAQPENLASKPSTPGLDMMTKDLWMQKLQLKPISGPVLSSELKRGIVFGDAKMVADIMQRQSPVVAPPALHLAALFGHVPVARFLINHGMDVNRLCDAKSASDGNIHGVTPMHLAIGAQHRDMIRLLHNNGASFNRPQSLSKKVTVAPPMWLILDRWLTMSGKDNAKDVLSTLRTLTALGWNTKAPLNEGGDTMGTLARRRLESRPDVRRAVLGFLQ